MYCVTRLIILCHNHIAVTTTFQRSLTITPHISCNTSHIRTDLATCTCKISSDIGKPCREFKRSRAISSFCERKLTKTRHQTVILGMRLVTMEMQGKLYTWLWYHSVNHWMVFGDIYTLIHPLSSGCLFSWQELGEEVGSKATRNNTIALEWPGE